jgi:hypothetical protein
MYAAPNCSDAGCAHIRNRTNFCRAAARPSLQPYNLAARDEEQPQVTSFERRFRHQLTKPMRSRPVPKRGRVASSRVKPLSTHSLKPTVSRPSGPPVALQPDLARTLALVIHEPATNAAKYGSLSSPTGRLAINWNFDNNAVALTWMECGGPSVVPPAKVGFGTTLIKSLQQSFSSMVDLDFRPAGLVCSVRFPVPTDGAPTSS